MKVQIVTPDMEAAWDRLVAEHPLGSVFHLSAFKKVIADTFPHTKPCYLALTDGHGAMKAGIALFVVRSWLTGTRLVSLPFAFYADPMVVTADECDLLLSEAITLYNKEHAKYIELKLYTESPLLEAIPTLQPAYVHKRFELDLSLGPDAIRAKFHKKAIINVLRNAYKRGMSVRIAESEKDLRQFCALLVRARREIGLPLQRYTFFKNMWRHLVSQNLMEFWLAHVDGTPVGGLQIYTYKGIIHAGYIAAPNRQAHPGVNQVLNWEIIRRGAECGYRVFDFGKASALDAGLITYKRRWGAVERDAPTLYYPCLRGIPAHNDERRLSLRLLSAVWRNLPAVLAKPAGSLFYRHMG